MPSASLTWRDFYETTARFLGYSDVTPENAASFPQEDRELRRCIDRGYRDFIRARRDHPWNFLYRMGEIPLVAGTDSYTLPDGLQSVRGPLRVKGTCSYEIPVVPWDMLRDAPDGRPCRAAIRRNPGGGGEIYLAPPPNFDGDLIFEYLLLPSAPTEDDPVPVGGEWHSDTIEAYIHAAADSLVNDVTNGEKQLRAMQLLTESVALDDQLVPEFHGNLHWSNPEYLHHDRSYTFGYTD